MTYTAAKRAKKSLLGDDLESQAKQFRLLPAHVDLVCAAGPPLSVEDHEGTRRFQGLFIRPGISLPSSTLHRQGRNIHKGDF